MAGLLITLRQGAEAIEGALVRAEAPALGRPAVSLTKAAGEALLLMNALPLAAQGDGAGVAPGSEVAVSAVIDAAVAAFHAPDAIPGARAAEAARRAGFVDPDRISRRAAEGDDEVFLAAPGTAVAVPYETRPHAIKWTPIP